MRAALYLPLLLLAGGCATASDCSRLPAAAAADDPLPPRLACEAGRGDQAAQYRAGLIREVEGDFKAAAKFYKRAAAPRSGQIAVYSPPVGKETYGRVMMLDGGPSSPGHDGARLALARLYYTGSGVRRDQDKAIDIWRRGIPGFEATREAIEALLRLPPEAFEIIPISPAPSGAPTGG